MCSDINIFKYPNYNKIRQHAVKSHLTLLVDGTLCGTRQKAHYMVKKADRTLVSAVKLWGSEIKKKPGVGWFYRKNRSRTVLTGAFKEEGRL